MEKTPPRSGTARKSACSARRRVPVPWGGEQCAHESDLFAKPQFRMPGFQHETAFGRRLKRRSGQKRKSSEKVLAGHWPITSPESRLSTARTIDSQAPVVSAIGSWRYFWPCQKLTSLKRASRHLQPRSLNSSLGCARSIIGSQFQGCWSRLVTTDLMVSLELSATFRAGRCIP